jgi:MFS family permease
MLWRNATVRRVLMMNWFVSAIWEMHGVMVPPLGHALGLSAAAIGSILGAFAIAAAAVRLITPWVGSRVREWELISGALTIAALLLALYPLVRSPVAVGLCSLMLGVAVGGVQPLVMSLVHQITPPHQHGQAVALRLVLINVSSISMPIVAGAAGGLAGAAGIFWAGAAAVLVGIRMAVGLRRMTPSPIR